jgi:hypothetical protein
MMGVPVYVACAFASLLTVATWLVYIMLEDHRLQFVIMEAFILAGLFLWILINNI